MLGRPPDAENQVELLLDTLAHEQGPVGDHLRENAADGPDVAAGGVGLAAQEDVGGPVPEGDHLVGQGLDRNRAGPRQPEVANLDDIFRLFFPLFLQFLQTDALFEQIRFLLGRVFLQIEVADGLHLEPGARLRRGLDVHGEVLPEVDQTVVARKLAELAAALLPLQKTRPYPSD